MLGRKICQGCHHLTGYHDEDGCNLYVGNEPKKRCGCQHGVEVKNKEEE